MFIFVLLPHSVTVVSSPRHSTDTGVTSPCPAPKIHSNNFIDFGMSSSGISEWTLPTALSRLVSEYGTVNFKVNKAALLRSASWQNKY